MGDIDARSTNAGSGLRGRRVLVVEDEAIVALLLEDMLEDIGCALVDSAASIEEALRVAEKTDAEAAILDVNLGGREIFPVAERLQARGIPLIFATGYGAAGLPERWRAMPVLGKPFVLDDLQAALVAAFAR